MHKKLSARSHLHASLLRRIRIRSSNMPLLWLRCRLHLTWKFDMDIWHEHLTWTFDINIWHGHLTWTFIVRHLLYDIKNQTTTEVYPTTPATTTTRSTTTTTTTTTTRRPCDVWQCVNGYCVEFNNQAECNCDYGYSGDHCEISNYPNH